MATEEGLKEAIITATTEIVLSVAVTEATEATAATAVEEVVQHLEVEALRAELATTVANSAIG